MAAARTLRAAPQVFRIDAGLSFVDVLATGILLRYGAHPAGLGRVTVLLPTRRAVKSLQDAFLRLSNGRALILPVMRPIGDVEEDELIFSPALSEADLALPPAAPPLWRQLKLTQLVEAFARRHADSGGSRAHAVELAAALAGFLDEVAIEGCDFADLAAAVPENFARHWQETLTFLEIVTREWPDILAARGFMDGAARRNHLLYALAALWQKTPPPDPVIAAGSTGSIPASAALIATVARLPEGAVVLPALDCEMDDESWAALSATHPQATMKKLLEDDIGTVRHDVRDWLAAEEAPGLRQGPAARRDLLKEILRPAETTAAWRDLRIDAATALQGFARIDAPSPREEAGAIALLMREALEQPSRTAALITPDRTLARRVAAELKRWGILIDDSAGVPLTETGPGVFLTLLAELAAQDFAPVALLAALKHPLAAGGLSGPVFRARVRALEMAVLRGPRPQGGSDGVTRAVRALEDDGLRDMLHHWWAGLAAVLQPFVARLAEGGDLRDLAEAHAACAERLAASDDRDGAARLWAGDAGDAAAAFYRDLLDGGADFEIEGRDYPAVLKALMAGRAVRPRYGRHPRLQIWGPLEARLQHADLVILGGLNEGVWPPDAGVDPWLSRPMRAGFGLPPLERRVGLSAHDFYVAASAPEVVLTRSEKNDGAPTVPSRWLMRLDAVLRGADLARHPALDWFAALDHPARIKPLPPPAPRPPLDVRPKRLSVTQIGTWMRDPYAIYARHILKLKALDPIDADPGAADKGNIIHGVLDRFLKRHPVDLPADALDQLIAIGREEFGRHLSRPTVRAFWWPRFLHVAEWFIATEQDRRGRYKTVLSEGGGDYRLVGPVDFTLSAKADRIDRGPGGSLSIIDYKTGQAPKPREIAAGYQPQLPLEAVMAEAGAFKGLAAAVVEELEFWRLHGGEPPADIARMKEIDARKAQALRGLHDLVALFAKAETPYLSRMRPEEVTAGDYDHLARIREWSGLGSLAGSGDGKESGG